MTDTDKPTFLSCLYHETKKASKPYVLILATAIDLLAATAFVVWVLYNLWDSIALFAKLVADVIWNIGVVIINAAGFIIGLFWMLVAAIPWWMYLSLLVALPPFLYALGVCIKRRATRYHKIVVEYTIGYLLFCCLLGSAVSLLGMCIIFLFIVTFKPLLIPYPTLESFWILWVMCTVGCMLILSPTLPEFIKEQYAKELSEDKTGSEEP